MKKSLFFLLFLCFVYSISAQNSTNKTGMNDYKSQWQQVEKLDQKDLPKSAIEIVDGILKKSIKDQNTQQTIKALIYKNKYKIVIDKQENVQIFSDLENLLADTNNQVDKALLHSILAELYLDYLDAYSWELSQRTNISDFIPEDMSEWSKNIFVDKAISHLNQSVDDRPILLDITTKSYSDIINLGLDSQKLTPTLYDFLINRAIDQSARVTSNDNNSVDFLKSLQSKKITIKDLSLPVSEYTKIDFGTDANLSTLQYYKDNLQSLLDRNLNNVIVFAEIKRNNYLSDRSDNYRSNYAYNFLLNIEKKNQANDYNVEVIDAIIQNLQHNNNSYISISQSPKSDDNTTEIYNWCKYGIDKYPNYQRIDILKTILDRLELPSANITGQAVYYPSDKNKEFKLEYKNLSEITIQIIDQKTQAIVETKQIELKPKTTYLSENIEFTIDTDKIGNYLLDTKYDKKKSTSDSLKFTISKLANFARKLTENKYEFYVVDRLNGSPIGNANITVYTSDWNRKKYTFISTIKTDDKGFATYEQKKNDADDLYFSYRVSLETDCLPDYNTFPYYYNYTTTAQYEKEIISIFSDRSIYRPGQTVYFKAVSTFQENPKTTLPNANKQYNVTLYNANNQIVTEKTLITNEFGSLAGEFVLPKGGLTGQYRIKVGNESQYFRVEEYKRPTFEIKFDKLDKTYAFGDEVKLVGHAENFSGIKLQNAVVTYTVVKKPFSFWRMYSSIEQVDNGTVTTGDDGSFVINFLIPENDLQKKGLNSIYNFEVEATVTDLNGETQKGNYSFVVGDVSMLLSVDIPNMLSKDSKEKIQIKATNLDGQSISSKGTYTLHSLLPNDSINVEVKTGDFSTGSDFDLMSYLQKIPSAKYVLSLKAKDSNNREVMSKEYFVLYSPEDKKPPIETNEWLVEKQTSFDLAQDAELIFGISAKDATILYELLKNDTVLLREQFKLSDSNRKIQIPYKDIYGDNITASFTYVIDGVPYSKQVTLRKKEEDKKLNLKLEVFRDKLRPGDHEEWRISVKDNEGNPALAELLASMYDSSLDKLSAPNRWFLNGAYIRTSYPSVFNANSFYTSSLYDSFTSGVHYKIEPLLWDNFNWFGFNLGNNRDRFGRWYATSTTTMALPASPVLKQSVLAREAPLSMGGEESYEMKSITNLNDEINELREISPKGSEKGDASTPQIRTNFNETAFFYPQLKTNADGETIISFTVPESNTTWKFRALAYDKNMNEGALEALTISRKELMVTPNLPRFVRQGDKTSISTKISNLSDQSLSGKARLEFFDPLTDKAINLNIDKYQNFNLDQNASISVSWLFDVPSDIDMIGVRIVAETTSFSDGEQHVIPVLPNKMLVTESMTMNLNEKQTKDFVFDRFVNNQSNTLSNYRLTLEYSSNPAWYAVQGLPTLSNPTNENVVNWFASYYVNTLGSSIMKKYPKVSNMIKQWKQQGGDKETLISKLQQNEELKTVFLEETPWVLDAKNETEQMNRLSLLFDINNTSMQTTQAIDKLKNLQNPDGGWSWYKGMYSDRVITQYILYGFTQLTTLGAVEYPSDIKEMQIKALKYIDDKIKEDYERLEKDKKELDKITNISTYQLEYIYVRSGYRDIPIDQSARKAERFYTSVAEKNWTELSLYERSLLAVVSLRNGNKTLSVEIIKSLREHATISDEMGMFWANNTNENVFMGRSAVAVHTFLMEAFRESKAPTKEMDLMKLWLLKQKQTQMWESTHATIDAIYALLSTGNDWLANDGVAKISVGDQLLQTDRQELGTGYVQTSWNTDQITNNMGNVKVEQTNDAPSWGAMYWQYYEALDKITVQKGELSVDKKLFVERDTEKGKSLFEVTTNNPLKVGDKVVVRLTVRADRDLDFVQLKDMRASCFEPINVISGLRWQNSAYYYESTKDASTNFYFDHLSKGTYIFEYPVYVNRVGEYSNGITSIQCLYAPQFVSHTQGITINVK